MIDVEQVCSFFARTLIFRLPNRAKGSDTSIKFPRSDLFFPPLRVAAPPCTQLILSIVWRFSTSVSPFIYFFKY